MKAKSIPKALPELEAHAHAEAQYGRHKEAIAAFKDLLKREKRPEWEAALAEAYRLRAAQVAAKGMYQEAVLLWENHAKLRPGAAVSEEFLYWLARGGSPAKLAQALAGLPDAIAQTPTGRQVAETVAILALDNDKLLAPLPPDHPIARQQPLFQQALAAYSAGRDADTEEILRGIPSRSPYRNLRTLLKALLVLGTDRPAAAALLERIEADSVCRSFAAGVRRVAASELPDLDAYFRLAGKTQGVINTLAGLGKNQAGLLRDIQKAAAAQAAKPLLDALLKYRAELGEVASRRIAHAVLVAHPEGIPLFERAFGKLAPFETYRIRALNAEHEGDHELASRHWLRCTEELRQRPDGEQEPLAQAAILRHVAKAAARPAPEVALDCLERSLQLDPGHKPGYLELIALADEEDQPKLAQTWLDALLKRFPRDPEALVLAMKAAGRRKSFKKAAGYAKTLLAIDPINSAARKFLIDAHLGHARKRLKSDRPDLARQELDEARALDPQRRQAAPLFLAGVVDYREDQRDAAAKLWQEAAALAGGKLVARFQLTLETLLAGVEANGPLRLLGALDKDYLADKAELLALVKTTGQYRDEAKSTLAAALQKLIPALKKSLKQTEATPDEWFTLCQGFADAALYDLLGACAKQGKLGSAGLFSPGMAYFEVLAKCKGNPADIGAEDEFRLNSALKDAKQADDRRALALIDSFLDKHADALDAEYGDFDDDMPPLPPGLDGLPEELVALGPEKLVAFMNKSLEIEHMDRQELIGYLAGGQSALRFKNLSLSQLQAKAMEKLLKEFGIQRTIEFDDDYRY